MPAPLQDLDRATWAEVPRDLYMAAAKYLVAHNVAYQGVTVSEENAREQFFQLGATCCAVRAQATQVATSETMPVKLDAPGDSSADGCVIAVKEAVVKDEVETQLESTADFSGVEVNQNGHDVEDDEAPPPGFQCVAGEVTSADLDVERCCKEFAAKLSMLSSRVHRVGGVEDMEEQLSSLKSLAETMSKADLQAKLDDLVKQIDAAEAGSDTSSGKWVQVVHTGSENLSMYSSEYYQKCFPELFPYGDGVYGLQRDTQLTYREWASYLLERVELEYAVDSSRRSEEADSRGSVLEADSRGAVPVFQPPIIPRWQADLNFVAVVSDSWKRMEMVRLASAHVRRKKFKDSLRVVLECTSAKLSTALRQLGDHATIGDVMRSTASDNSIRDAISQLLFFSSEVVGTDGARQQLRHEQNGAMLMCLGNNQKNISLIKHPEKNPKKNPKTMENSIATVGVRCKTQPGSVVKLN